MDPSDKSMAQKASEAAEAAKLKVRWDLGAGSRRWAASQKPAFFH